MYTDTPKTGAACSTESRRAGRRGVVSFGIPVVFRMLVLALKHVRGYVVSYQIVYPWCRGAYARGYQDTPHGAGPVG
jgi:hypothetical protein